MLRNAIYYCCVLCSLLSGTIFVAPPSHNQKNMCGNDVLYLLFVADKQHFHYIWLLQLFCMDSHTWCIVCYLYWVVPSSSRKPPSNKQNIYQKSSGLRNSYFNTQLIKFLPPKMTQVLVWPLWDLNGNLTEDVHPCNLIQIR